MTDHCKHGDCAKVKAMLSEYLDEELHDEVLRELNERLAA